MNEFGGSFPQISILVCEFCRIAVDSGRVLSELRSSVKSVKLVVGEVLLSVHSNVDSLFVQFLSLELCVVACVVACLVI
jgi:predicted RNA-binding protein with EMAP domain